MKAAIYRILKRHKADEPLCCQYFDAGHILGKAKIVTIKLLFQVSGCFRQRLKPEIYTIDLN